MNKRTVADVIAAASTHELILPGARVLLRTIARFRVRNVWGVPLCVKPNFMLSLCSRARHFA